MKMKKTIVSLLALLLVVGLTIGGTVAYLRANDTAVVNHFDFGGIGVDLYEDDVDANGQPIKNQIGITYENLYAGQTVDKTPRVDVTCDVACYVFLKVTNSAYVTPGDFVTTYWTAVPGVDNVYYHEFAADTASEQPLFKTVTVSANLDVVNGNVVDTTTNTTVCANTADGLKALDVTVDVYAIQAEGWAAGTTMQAIYAQAINQ